LTIKNIKISNFKSFRDLNFELKRINILLGPNNSGKSNILKLFLLLKQTFTSTLQSPLILNGNIINLGSYRDITYQFNSDKIKISFEFYPNNIRKEKGITSQFKRFVFPMYFEIEYEYDDKLAKLNVVSVNIKDIEKGKNFIGFELKKHLFIQNQKVEKYISNFKTILNQLISCIETFPKFEFKIKGSPFKRLSRLGQDINLNIKYPSIDYLFKYFLKFLKKFADRDIYIEYSSNSKFPEIDTNIRVDEKDFITFREFLLQLYILRRYSDKHIETDDIALVNKEIENIYKLESKLKDLSDFLENVVDSLYLLKSSLEYYFKDLYYIGPLRNIPERYYSIIGEMAKDVGFKGELVPYILKQSQENKELKKVINKVAYWLEQFEMAKETDIKRYKEIDEFISILFKEYFSGLKVNITDMGIGTSQILPIIIEGFIINEGSVLLIEQPEIHLHPKAQAILGDLFVDIMKEDKYLIIETHSEHLMQRIERRIAECEISKEDVNFYYITMSKDGSIIKKITLNDNGIFENIPDGFFDDDYKEAYEHLKVILNKKNNK